MTRPTKRAMRMTVVRAEALLWAAELGLKIITKAKFGTPEDRLNAEIAMDVIRYQRLRPNRESKVKHRS